MSYYLNDIRWHGYYIAPAGIEGEPCRHAKKRMGIGPSYGKTPGFTADVCWSCGRIMRGVRDISWQQYFWARRYNNSIK